jgi:hypothetical protein
VLSVPGGAAVSTVAAGSALYSHRVGARSLGCCGSHGKRQPPVLGQHQGCLQRDGSSTRHMATHVFVIFAIVRVASQKLPSKTCALRTIQISGRLLRPPAFVIRHAITPTSLGLKRGMACPLPSIQSASETQKSRCRNVCCGDPIDRK